MGKPIVKDQQSFGNRCGARRRPLMPLSVNGLPIFTPQRIHAGLRWSKNATQEEVKRFFGFKSPALRVEGDPAEAENRMRRVWARWGEIEAEKRAHPSAEQETDCSEDLNVANRVYAEVREHSALEVRAALWWRETIIRRVLRGQHTGGRRELDYAAYDGSDFNVVLCRTWREIKADCPGFWVRNCAKLPAGFEGHIMATAPTLEWVVHWWQRYHEYRKLLGDAEREYRRLVYIANFYRPASRAGPPREKPAADQQQGQKTKGKSAIRRVERAIARYTPTRAGDTHAQNRKMPHHIRIACDAARGMIKESRLIRFLREKFLDLPASSRQEFLSIYDAEPIMRRGTEFIISWAWLLDNAAVFHRYQWHWDAIHAAMAARFKKQRLTIDAMKNMWANRPIAIGDETTTINLGVEVDSAPEDRRTAQPHVELLTPPPAMP